MGPDLPVSAPKPENEALRRFLRPANDRVGPLIPRIFGVWAALNWTMRREAWSRARFFSGAKASGTIQKTEESCQDHTPAGSGSTASTRA